MNHGTLHLHLGHIAIYTFAPEYLQGYVAERRELDVHDEFSRAIIEREASEAAQLGFAVLLLQQCERRSGRISALAGSLLIPIRLGQFQLLRSTRDGHPVAFATWAFLSDAVLAEMRETPQRPLHPSEWNEGLNACIIDVVAPFGGARALLMDVIRGPLAAARVTAVRQRRRGRVLGAYGATDATRTP